MVSYFESHELGDNLSKIQKAFMRRFLHVFSMRLRGVLLDWQRQIEERRLPSTGEHRDTSQGRRGLETVDSKEPSDGLVSENEF